MNYTYAELLEDLNNENVDIRRYIPDKLAKGNFIGAIDVLGDKIFDTSEELIVKIECTEALGKLGSAKAISFLERITIDDDKELVRTALWSLGQIGGKRAASIIIRLVRQSNDQFIGRWGVKMLGYTGSTTAYEFLKRYRCSGSTLVEKIRSLRKLATSQVATDNDSICEELMKCLEDSLIGRETIMALNTYNCRTKSIVQAVNNLFLLSDFKPLQEASIVFLGPLVSADVLESCLSDAFLCKPALESLIAHYPENVFPAIMRYNMAASKAHSILYKYLFDSKLLDIINSSLSAMRYVSSNPILNNIFAIANSENRNDRIIEQLQNTGSVPLSILLTLLKDLEFSENLAGVVVRYVNHPEKKIRETLLQILMSNNTIPREVKLDALRVIAEHDSVWHIRRDARRHLEKLIAN